MALDAEELALSPEQTALLREQTAAKKYAQTAAQPFGRGDGSRKDMQSENQGIVF